jgi:polysaccharide export outer membrane protein
MTAPVAAGATSCPIRPTSYFLAQDFAMRNGDLIYFANAKTNTVSKLFGLIGQLVAPAATGAVIH